MVIVLWATEGMFPSSRSVQDSAEGEAEERRLFYVAATRAQDELILCVPEYRRMRDGGGMPCMASRFIDELPDHLVEPVRPRQTATAGIGRTESRPDSSGDHGLRLGGTVSHQRFGIGTIVSLEGQGDNARVQVNFEQAGSKWLVLAYASLERLD